MLKSGVNLSNGTTRSLPLQDVLSIKLARAPRLSRGWEGVLAGLLQGVTPSAKLPNSQGQWTGRDLASMFGALESCASEPQGHSSTSSPPPFLFLYPSSSLSTLSFLLPPRSPSSVPTLPLPFPSSLLPPHPSSFLPFLPYPSPSSLLPPCPPSSLSILPPPSPFSFLPPSPSSLLPPRPPSSLLPPRAPSSLLIFPPSSFPPPALQSSALLDFPLSQVSLTLPLSFFSFQLFPPHLTLSKGGAARGR